MVVGFKLPVQSVPINTTVARSNPLGWGVLDTTLCDSLSVTCDRSVIFFGYSVARGFLQKFVTIVLTFSLEIILRQFLSPFHKDYLTTNFNLTTKITLTIKNSSLGVLDIILCDKVCQWFATGQWFSPSTPVFSTNKADRYNVERGVKHCKPSSLAT